MHPWMSQLDDSARQCGMPVFIPESDRLRCNQVKYPPVKIRHLCDILKAAHRPGGETAQTLAAIRSVAEGHLAIEPEEFRAAEIICNAEPLERVEATPRERTAEVHGAYAVNFGLGDAGELHLGENSIFSQLWFDSHTCFHVWNFLTLQIADLATPKMAANSPRVSGEARITRTAESLSFDNA